MGIRLMSRWLTIVLALAVPLTAAAQETSSAPRTSLPKAKDRFGWMAQLRVDASLALDRVPENSKLHKTVQKDVDSLRQALDAHMQKRKVDDRKLNAALVSLYNTFSNARNEFRPEERAHVMEDLEHVPQKQIKEKPLRPMNPPRQRRYPRY